MKQITALILVFVLVFLCGCTTKKANESDTTTVTESQSAILKTVPTEPITTVVLSDEETDETLFYPKEIKVDPSDPYSSFIKKLCEQYAKEWEDYSKNCGRTPNSFYHFSIVCPDFYYYFYDLDGDGTKELLLGGYGRIGEYTEDYNPPVKIVITYVCTIKNGEVVVLDNRNSWKYYKFIWDRFLLSNGRVVTIWGEKDTPNYYIIDYENGKLVRKCYIFKESPDSGFYKVTNDDTFETQKISMSEYESIYNDLCGNAKPVEIDWKRIDEYGT